MTSRLRRSEAKCATQVLPMPVGPFAFRYQGNTATPSQYVDTTRKAIDCATTLPLRIFYIMKLLSRLYVLYCRNCPKDDKFRYFVPILAIPVDRILTRADARIRSQHDFKFRHISTNTQQYKNSFVAVLLKLRFFSYSFS